MIPFFFLLFFSNCIAGEIFIEGGKIEYKDDLISASTKTTIVFEDMKIEAEAIKIKGDTILCTSSHLKTEDLQFFGKEIRKEKESVKIEDGWFSTCSNRNPHFRLISKHITIGPRIVKASRIKLVVGKLPIFYMPFYSSLLKSEYSPLSTSVGRSDYLGFFVKTRYNYCFEEKRGSVFLDYYQKRSFGLGGNIIFNNSDLFAYYNKRDKWFFNLFYKKPPFKISIEKLSDRTFLYNYLKGDIKDQTKSYIMLEKTGEKESKRLVFEERDDFLKERYYLVKGNIFLSGRPYLGLITSLDLSGECVYKDSYNFTINPRISKRISYILQTIDVKVKEKGEKNVSSISYIKLIDNKHINLDMGYSSSYSFKEKKKENKIVFFSEGDFPLGIISIEGEFLLSSKKLDDIMFLCSNKYGKIDGSYKNGELNASIFTGFEKERYGAECLFLIKGHEKQTIIPSLLLKRKGLSLKIKGHYGGENYLELSILKAYHCINLDFMINTNVDIGIALSLR